MFDMFTSNLPNEIIQYFLLLLVVFSLSSGWLYSEGPRELREWFFNFFDTFDFKYMKKIKWLSVCQLCISFWFALFFEWMIMKETGVFSYIFIAISVAGLSWVMGAITNYFLWAKAYYEIKVKYITECSRKNPINKDFK